MTIISSNGYFTLARYVVDLDATRLEKRLGYSPGALAAGWLAATPVLPFAPNNIILRGSTRWSSGTLSPGVNIADVIEARADVDQLRAKVAAHFDRGLANRPVKLFRVDKTVIEYPNAPDGVPQFEARSAVQWRVVTTVAPGGMMSSHDFLPALY